MKSPSESMTPTTAREFAERLLNRCARIGTCVTWDEREADRLEFDRGAATALIEADRLATTQAALEPFRALLEEWQRLIDGATEHTMSDDTLECLEGAHGQLRKLLPPAEKAATPVGPSAAAAQAYAQLTESVARCRELLSAAGQSLPPPLARWVDAGPT
jgi:hypothetical protein